MSLMVVLSIFFLSQATYASSCMKNSQHNFCRLIRCIEGTQWKVKGIEDPFIYIKNKGDRNYDAMIMPGGVSGNVNSVYVLNQKGLVRYEFQSKERLPPRCDKKGKYEVLPIKGQCVGDWAFGIDCLWKKQLHFLHLQPYRVNYWDGKRVHYLCKKWLDQESEKKMLKKESWNSIEMSQRVTPFLKQRMLQLARAVRADDKSIDYEQVYHFIRDGKSLKDIGECRYFLDGNTLNLLIEALDKKYKKKK